MKKRSSEAAALFDSIQSSEATKSKEPLLTKSKMYPEWIKSTEAHIDFFTKSSSTFFKILLVIIISIAVIVRLFRTGIMGINNYLRQKTKRVKV